MVLKVNVKDKVKVTRAWKAWGTSMCLNSKAGDCVVRFEELRDVQHELGSCYYSRFPLGLLNPNSRMEHLPSVSFPSPFYEAFFDHLRADSTLL